MALETPKQKSRWGTVPPRAPKSLGDHSRPGKRVPCAPIDGKSLSALPQRVQPPNVPSQRAPVKAQRVQARGTQISKESYDTNSEAKRQLELDRQPLKVLPFALLPPEIQLQVFEYLLYCPLPFRVIPSGGHALDSAVRARGIDRAFDSTASSFLLVSKRQYQLFAPAFYRYMLIIFSDPVEFAKTFLARCDQICLANLQKLECRFDNRGSIHSLLSDTPPNKPGCPNWQFTPPECQILPFASEDTRALTELLLLYGKELPNLSEFRVVYEFGARYGIRDIERHEMWWTTLDDEMGKVFSNFQSKMVETVFKDFEAKRGLTIDFDDKGWIFGYSHVVEELFLTFKRG